MARSNILLCILFLFIAEHSSGAEENVDPNGPAAGHSYHGEAFNEGPRQRAYLMGNTGNVNFKITTESEEAQKFFNQGVGQLHGFWYFEAERSFRQVALIDPDCAMAYWGMARANGGNEKRARGFINEAVKRKKNASKREQMYIELIHKYVNTDKKKDKERRQAYLDGMREIIKTFPDDIEAKAFFAVAQWHSKSKIKIKNYDEVDKLLQEVLKVNPMHPCHHYRIHLWDYKKASNALDSAARCGHTAPGIAHMWHMPGHIYSKLKRYADGAWQQEASARVDHAHMMRDRVMPDQIHNFAHNNEWLVRNLINIGRVHDALDLAKNMTELPRHPKYNTFKKGSAKYGRDRIYSVLTRYELWDEAIRLCNSVYIETGDDHNQQVKRLRLLGSALFKTGELAKGDAILADLNKRLAAKRKELEPVKKDKKNSGPIKGQISSTENAINLLEAYRHQRNGNHTAALERFMKVKGLDKSILARAQSYAGMHDKAIKTAEATVKSKAGQAWALADQVYILHRAGKKDKAAHSMRMLRTLGEHADLDPPVFARVTPVATSIKLPKDWRRPMKKPKDLGTRPDLDSLGPFRWQPTAAPGWKLPEHDGNMVSLSDYKGRSVLVVLYLGFGCLHCVEQLNAIAPHVKAFRDLGIEIVAISSDKVNGLADSIKAYSEDGAFPFTIVSDPELRVFKAYRALDDFEAMPLHGTFLIDGKGLVRWQDISYEPFMETEFLLKEAKRLLSSSTATTAVSAK